MASPEDAHSEALSRLRVLCDILAPRTVGAAFVASLSSRRLAYRSALGSFAYARFLPEHEFEPEPEAYAAICKSCRWHRMPPGEEEPIEHLAGERERLGGIRHLDPIYALYDLETFVASPALDPTPADWSVLRSIVATPAVLAPTAKPADFAGALKGVLPSNNYERQALLRILCYAGVLQPKEYPTFFREWVPPHRWVTPNYRFTEWGYPTIWWRAADGVNAEALDEWFPGWGAV